MTDSAMAAVPQGSPTSKTAAQSRAVREGGGHSSPGANPVTCVCGRTLWLQPKRSPRKGLRFFGAVCDCGRGADLFIEKEPGSEARHG